MGNATELPKCSKTLHFYCFDAVTARYLVSELKANISPDLSGSDAAFAVPNAGNYGLSWDFLGSLS
jgi:hypothetical protein